MLLWIEFLYFNALLKEMSGSDCGIGEQGPVVFQLLDSCHVDNRVALCLDVRISWTFINSVTHLLTAITFDILRLLLADVFGSIIVIIIILFALVL